MQLFPESYPDGFHQSGVRGLVKSVGGETKPSLSSCPGKLARFYLPASAAFLSLLGNAMLKEPFFSFFTVTPIASSSSSVRT